MHLCAANCCEDAFASVEDVHRWDLEAIYWCSLMHGNCEKLIVPLYGLVLFLCPNCIRIIHWCFAKGVWRGVRSQSSAPSKQFSKSCSMFRILYQGDRILCIILKQPHLSRVWIMYMAFYIKTLNSRCILQCQDEVKDKVSLENMA